jgi:cell division protein FtsB
MRDKLGHDTPKRGIVYASKADDTGMLGFFRREVNERMIRDRRGPRQQPGAEERRILPVRPAYIVLAILLALFALKFVQKMQEVRQLQSQENALQISNNQTQRQNAHLQAAIHYYGTPQYIQQEARGVLGDTMPGDVLILTRPRLAPVLALRAAPSKPLSPPKPSWEQWWHAVVH